MHCMLLVHDALAGSRHSPVSQTRLPGSQSSVDAHGPLSPERQMPFMHMPPFGHVLVLEHAVHTFAAQSRDTQSNVPVHE